jgi:hypothetical protein
LPEISSLHLGRRVSSRNMEHFEGQFIPKLIGEISELNEEIGSD